MPVFNKFHYSPLMSRDSIRLIILDPAANDQAHLSCSLIQVLPGDESVPYHAISYVWGEQDIFSPQPLEIHYCDDNDDSEEDAKSETSYLRITPNVDTVLRRFRSPTSATTTTGTQSQVVIWLDAICLNQTDPIEKSQQVPRMGEIYAKAEGVYIWLGEHNGVTRSVFRFFRKVNKIPVPIQEDKIRQTQPDRAKKVASLMRRILPQHEENGPSGLGIVGDFFQRAWFSRRWVIQEATLASQATVFCGDYSLPLAVVATAAKRMQDLSMSDYHFRMATKLFFSTHEEMRRDMLELLWDFHDAKCQDPRDRIAALLGLLSPKDTESWFDYTLPWQDMYRQLAEFMLEHGTHEIKRQVILHLFEFGSVNVSDNRDKYPSWVPDWSQRRRRRTLPFHSAIREVDTYETYPISPGYPPLSRFQFSNGTLRLSWNVAFGGPCGLQVKFLKHFSSPAENTKSAAKRVIQLLEDLLPEKTKSSPDIIALASLVKAVVGFRWTWREALQSKSLDNYLEMLCQCLASSSSNLNTQLPMVFRNLDHLLQEFSLFSTTPSAGFGFGLEFDPDLVTDSAHAPRYYGLGPVEINPEDILVPIWRPGFASDHKFRLPDDISPVTSIDAVTMLVVRPVLVPVPVPVDEKGRKEELVGRVIGPAVCVRVGTRDAKDIEGWQRWVQSCAGWRRNSLRLV